MSRLIEFGNRLEAGIDGAGGVLAVGLYAPRQDVGDISGRFRQAPGNTPPWLRRVFPSARSGKAAIADRIDPVLTAVGQVSTASPSTIRRTMSNFIRILL